MSDRKLDDPAAIRFLEDVAARIVARRIELGMEPEALALRVGVGYPRLRQMESGKVSLKHITALAEALDVEPYWLLHGVTESQARIGELVEQLQRETQTLQELLVAGQ